jgi:hypothetical protein
MTPEEAELARGAHETLARILKSNKEAAWQRHCDIAHANMEGGLLKWKEANEAACRVMMSLFGVDTSPQFIEVLKQRAPVPKAVVETPKQQ